jgi:hypothetical protein
VWERRPADVALTDYHSPRSSTRRPVSEKPGILAAADLVDHAVEGSGDPSRLASGKVLGERLSVEPAARLARPPGEPLGAPEEAVLDRDRCLHTRSMTASLLEAGERRDSACRLDTLRSLRICLVYDCLSRTPSAAPSAGTGNLALRLADGGGRVAGLYFRAA